jgi:hypothetical protein
LADEALESFAVTIPLLQFHDVHSRCPSSDKVQREPAEEQGNLDDDIDEEDGAAWSEPTDNAKLKSLAEIIALQQTNGKPILKYHPYIVTR